MGQRESAVTALSGVMGLGLSVAVVVAVPALARADDLADAKLAQQACERIVEPRIPAPFDATEIQCYLAGDQCAEWSGVTPDGQQGERCAVRVYLRGGRVAALRRLYLSRNAEGYQLDDHCYRPDGSLAVVRSEGETADGDRIDATVWYDAHGQELAVPGRAGDAGAGDAADAVSTVPPPYLWTAQIEAEIERLDPDLGGADDAPDPFGLSSIEAKRALEKRAGAVFTLLKQRNFHALAGLVHPVEGVRLSSGGRVDLSRDRVVMRAHVRELGLGRFMHGTAGAEGDAADIAVEWDFDVYYEHYIYDRDYAFAPQVSYNCPIGDAGAVDAVENVYDDAVVVEHRFPAITERSAPSGSAGLKLVFKRHEGAWYLVGIVHDGVS